MPRGVDLTGDWWSGWQTYRDGTEHLAVQPVHFAREDELLEVAAAAHGFGKDEGAPAAWFARPVRELSAIRAERP